MNQKWNEPSECNPIKDVKEAFDMFLTLEAQRQDRILEEYLEKRKKD